MKTDSFDVRRIHTLISHTDKGRRETNIVGDIRTVVVDLEPGEVDDIATYTDRFGKRVPTSMRPREVRLRWQRNRHWEGGRWGNQSWGHHDKVHDGWVLEDASIVGSNVLKDGKTGKESMSEFHSSNCHIETPLDEMPEWFAVILKENDPDKTGSPLDNEPNESVPLRDSQKSKVYHA
jgi:hypothetical protein